MHEFEYIRAESKEHALSVKAEYEDDAVVIAGGQSLLNILKQGLMAPEYLLDVKGLDELAYVRFDEKEGLRLGAMTVHRAVEKSPEILEHYPVLAACEQHLASVQIRNWGTLGGNLCIADPTGDPAPVLLALNAEAVLAKEGGERTVPVSEFFVDYYETVLEDDELLVEVRVPAPVKRSGAAYEKFRNVEGDAPIVVASAWMELDGGTAKDVRVGLGGVASTAVRAEKVEALLKGQKLTAELIAQAAERAVESTSPIPDIVCSPEYKNEMAVVMTRRTLTRAWEAALA